MKTLRATYDEIFEMLKSAFDGHEVEKNDKGKWNKISISGKSHNLSVYTYTRREADKDGTEKCTWYFNFYSIVRSNSVETTICDTPGFISFYKEAWEKACTLQESVKIAENELFNITEKELRNWKIEIIGL